MLYSSCICRVCGRKFYFYECDINTPQEEYCPECLTEIERIAAIRE